MSLSSVLSNCFGVFAIISSVCDSVYCAEQLFIFYFDIYVNFKFKIHVPLSTVLSNCLYVLFMKISKMTSGHFLLCWANVYYFDIMKTSNFVCACYFVYL